MVKREAYVVTGGGRGIGRAVVKQLAQTDVVVAIDSVRGRLDQAGFECPDGHFFGIEGDVTDRAALERCADAAESHGTLRGWVNNAAAFELGPLHEASETSIRRVLEVNLMAAMFGTSIAVRRFLSAGVPGAIVNVSSIHGSRGFRGWAAYDVSKAGLEGLTRSTAVEYGPSGIRANAVAPGTIAVERYTERLAELTQEERVAVERRIAAPHPLGRPGRPEEVASVICFLLGEGASFVNGVTLPVDGGWAIGGWPDEER